MSAETDLDSDAATLADESVNGMPVLGYCQRCGRGILTFPASYRGGPLYDAYGLPKYPYPVCGGKYELTRAGVHAAVEIAKEVGAAPTP